MSRHVEIEFLCSQCYSWCSHVISFYVAVCAVSALKIIETYLQKSDTVAVLYLFPCQISCHKSWHKTDDVVLHETNLRTERFSFHCLIPLFYMWECAHRVRQLRYITSSWFRADIVQLWGETLHYVFEWWCGCRFMFDQCDIRWYLPGYSRYNVVEQDIMVWSIHACKTYFTE